MTGRHPRVVVRARGRGEAEPSGLEAEAEGAEAELERAEAALEGAEEETHLRDRPKHHQALAGPAWVETLHGPL